MSNISTFYTPKYAKTNLLSVITQNIGIYEINNQQYLDLLSPNYTQIMKYITDTQVYNVESFEHLPNIAYKMYGNTTLWWIIASYNGIINPLLLQPGTVLQIPNLSQINIYLNSLKTNIGKKITI